MIKRGENGAPIDVDKRRRAEQPESESRLWIFIYLTRRIKMTVLPAIPNAAIKK